MTNKLLDKIVIDINRHLFNSVESIKEKLDYYRQLSKKGLSNLTEEEFISLQQDIRKFFNVVFTASADAYPTKLFRISFNKPITNEGRGGRLQKVSQLLGVPADKSTLNRCNFPGESIFYCALDFNTAVWETQPQFGDVITVSEWKIKEGQKLILHTIFNHPDIDNVNEEAKKAYEGYLKEMDKVHPKQYELFDTVIKFVTEEFIKPIPKDKPKEYLFSAHFASVLYLPSPSGFRIEAISYPSVQRKYGVTNLAIQNSLALNKLELIATTTCDVMQTNYDIDPISTEPFFGVFPAYRRITDFDIENDKIIYPNPKVELQSAMERIMKKENSNG
jgi:hypothetical protein